MRDKPGPIHGKCLTCNSRSLTRSLIHLFDRRAGPATRSSGLPFSPSSSLKRYYYLPQLSRLSLETDRILTNSVSDPSHFDVDPDPDPGIHIWEKWIRILGSTSS